MRSSMTISVACAVGLVLLVGVLIGVDMVGSALEPQELGGPVALVDARAEDAATMRVSLSLAYLTDVPEVAWYVVQGNDAYLGFDGPSESMEAIVREAAVYANEAYGSAFRAWAVPVDKADQIGQESMPFFCRATARAGEVVDFSQP